MSDSIRARDILKKAKILTHQKTATLAQALSGLNSSHDAAFIVQNDNFLGVINPYYTQFKSNYPPETKVAHCLFIPPKLYLDSSFDQIVKSMLQSKIYFLPVIDKNEEFLGIVTIRRLLRAVLKDKDLITKLDKTLKPKTKLVTAKKDLTVSQTRSLLTKKGISRLPIVDKSDRLIGILTRYDIREALAKPKSPPSFLSRSGEKQSQMKQPVSNYMIKNVFTAGQNEQPSKLLETMLSENIGSIVFTNKNFKPTGIITYKDILESLINAQTPLLKLAINFPNQFKYQKQFNTKLEANLETLQKKVPLTRFESRINLIMGKGGDQINEYEIDMRASNLHISAFSKSRLPDWKDAFNEAFKKVENQLLYKFDRIKS